MMKKNFLSLGLQSNIYGIMSQTKLKRSKFQVSSRQLKPQAHSCHTVKLQWSFWVCVNCSL